MMVPHPPAPKLCQRCKDASTELHKGPRPEPCAWQWPTGASPTSGQISNPAKIWGEAAGLDVPARSGESSGSL